MPAPSGPREASADEPDGDGRVVHLVHRSNAQVVDRLTTLARALRSHGLPQTVILLGDARRRGAGLRLDAGIRTVVADAAGWRAPRALWSALREEFARRGRVAAVHTHGQPSGLLAILAAKLAGPPMPLHFAVHGERPPRLLERAATRLCSGSMDPSSRPPLPRIETDWIAPDVANVFFDVLRREAERPSIITASRDGDARHASRFAQLAVLLASTGVAFHWLGPAGPAATAQLAAADVAQFDARSDLERADRLQQAWVFVDPGTSSRAFPHRLAEAMATGLPCVAWDTAVHRALIEHERTGLLCDSAGSLLDGIARLIDSAALRAQLGAAARAQAYARFNVDGRIDALVAAYRADGHAAPRRDAGSAHGVAARDYRPSTDRPG